MQRGVYQFSQSREVSAKQLKRSVYLSRGGMRAKVEPDGASSWLLGAGARKVLFGRVATEVFKIQSGVKIAVRAQDYSVRAAPAGVHHSPRGPDKVQAAHYTRLSSGGCEGWVRGARLTNKSDSVVRLRVLTLHDPTSLNYRRERDAPGEIGVNAFNRNDQVVMDDVGDSTGVRVMGFHPRPTAIYMTKDRGRAAELMALGELPESSLGMSGSVIVLTQHDLDLAPGSSAHVRSSSVYHPASLEAALSSAGEQLEEGYGDADEGPGLRFGSSSASLNFAFEWARASIFAIECEENPAERISSGVALSMLRGDRAEELAEWGKRNLRKDGTIRYSGPRHPDDGERPGPLETSLLLIALCAHLAFRASDKRRARKWFPLVKKLAEGLSRMGSGGLVASPAGSPDGWRRRLGAGFPTGQTAEVNLAAVRALRDAASAARLAGKGSESARLRELSVRLLGSINERLRDPESGALALNADPRGVVHKELTVDQAVGLSLFAPDQNLASSVVHRLLEKDFETGWGPRTVPSSNNLYYHPSYGDGQLGGYWTRAALSHALLAFSTGYPSIGSAQLEKVARLVHLDAERLGGVPGEFPYWLDPERRQIPVPGSDPVAASRLLEAVVFGEAGLTLGPEGARIRVPEASKLRWLFAHDLEAGRRGSLFVGRAPGRNFVFTSLGRDAVEASRLAGATPTTSRSLAACETLTAPGVQGLVFWDADATVVCVGTADGYPFSGAVRVPARSKSFSTSIFAQVEELQPETGLWTKTERVKLVPGAELRVELEPGSWKVLKLSRAR